MLNRVVLITGASSGIGAATARYLAQSSRLALVARRQDRLQALAQQIREDGGHAEVISADLTDLDAPARVVAETVARFGGLDAVVNNAGIFVTAPSSAIDAAHIDHLYALNVRAPMLVVQAAIPHLAQRGGGWIVNVSSVAAEQPFPHCGVYAATKAALEQWSRVLREEVRGLGIRVSVVAPGATITEAWGAASAGSSSTPGADRACRAEDIAAAIAQCLNQPASACIDRLIITPPAGPL